MPNKFHVLKNKKIFIVDTETTGLPIRKPKIYTPAQYYNYKDYEKYDPSRMVQLSWTIMHVIDNSKTDIIKDYMIKPSGFIIPDSKFHNVTHKIAMEKGFELSQLVLILLQDLNSVDFIIGHNIWFDINIIMSELSRLVTSNKIEPELLQHTKNCMKTIYKLAKNNKIVCSGVFSKNILKLKSHHPKYFKMPKLIELYKYYYGEEFENQHDSKYDVLALLKCIVKTCNLQNYIIKL